MFISKKNFGLNKLQIRLNLLGIRRTDFFIDSHNIAGDMTTLEALF